MPFQGVRMEHRQVVGIDALRIVAATLVAIFHLGTAWYALVSGSIEAVPFPELVPLTRNGWVGVDIFFVISGFVIAHSANGATSAGFARSRFLRLVPGAWICASITLTLALATRLATAGELALPYANAVLFVPVGPWIDCVYWTLGIELAFYGVIFVLLFLGAWHRMPLVVGALGIASAAFNVIIVLDPSFMPKELERATQLLLLQEGCLFALGTFLWLSLTQAATRLRLTMIVVLLAGCALEVVAQNANFMHMIRVEGGVLAPLTVFLAAMTALVASVVWNERLIAALGRRGAGFMRTVGLATYPFYLLHNVSGPLLLRCLVDAGLPRIPALIATVAAVMALSLLVTRTAEPRLRRLLARALSERPRSPALEAA